MGNYNPNKPVILGVEWVPVVGDVQALDLNTELGYSFTVTGAPHNTVDAFSSAVLTPASAIAGQTMLWSIYPEGRENDTGEIRVARFTVQTAFVTGAAVSGAATAVLALADSSDGSSVQFTNSSHKLRATMGGTLPTDARVLGVDLLYQAAGTPGFSLEPTIESNTVIYPYGPYIVGPTTLAQVADTSVVRFGDVNPWWSTSAGPNTSSLRSPWRQPDMARWSSLGTGGQLYIGIRVNSLPASGVARLGYLAMNVYYCTESRVAYGGRAFGQDLSGALTFDGLTVGGSTQARDPNLATPVTLTPGRYTVTTTMADAGDKYNAGDHIKVGALFQHAKVVTHPTLQIEKFRRPNGNLPARAPVTSETDYMVSAMMAGSLDPLQFGMAPVDYCGLEGAPVYLTTTGTSIFATQQIHNEALAADTTYEQVRFYARRFEPEAPGDLTITTNGGLVSATITAAEFAELPELVLGAHGAGTGWKEVTLDIASQFLTDATFSDVTWTMTGVSTSSAIDQYQILVARTVLTNKYETPVVGGTFYGGARYDGVQKASLTWVAPEDSTPSVPDATTNATAVVMFSQNSPTVSGLTVEQLTQELSVVDERCARASNCIPTGILYNHLEWSPGSVTCDTFTRTVAAGGWGTADTGQSWAANIGAEFLVNGTHGIIAINAVNAERRASIDGPILDGRVRGTVRPGAVAVGAPIDMALTGRRDTGTNTNYLAEIQFGLLGVATLRVRRKLGGVLTTIQSFTLPTYTATSEFIIEFQYVGTQLQAKAWLSDAEEPVNWQITVTDANITAAGQVGVSALLEAGNSNTLPLRLSFDDFTATDILLADSTYEVQRMDEVDEEWQTIAEPGICAVSFDDYEARVGVESTYRIRNCNVGGFCGPWSTEVAATLTAPGVTIAGDGNSVLIFTSNHGPTGNLAYVMNWEGDVREDFIFPEAGFTQLRPQYQRDFFTAYHGTERGGEQFSRMLLVNAAAVPPESLANFRGLRDLAWADLPYVCVRDELGNRWFAYVSVPNGNVRNNRRLYFANVNIIEVTSTPAPVTA